MKFSKKTQDLFRDSWLAMAWHQSNAILTEVCVWGLPFKFSDAILSILTVAIPQSLNSQLEHSWQVLWLYGKAIIFIKK